MLLEHISTLLTLKDHKINYIHQKIVTCTKGRCVYMRAVLQCRPHIPSMNIRQKKKMSLSLRTLLFERFLCQDKVSKRFRMNSLLIMYLYSSLFQRYASCQYYKLRASLYTTAQNTNRHFVLKLTDITSHLYCWFWKPVIIIIENCYLYIGTIILWPHGSNDLQHSCDALPELYIKYNS